MKLTLYGDPLGRCVCEKEKYAWWNQWDRRCVGWINAQKFCVIGMKMKR